MDNETRSIWQNIKILFQSITNTATISAEAVSKVARIGDELASAGLCMAESNHKLVSFENEHKEKRAMDKLIQMYGEDNQEQAA